MKPKLNKALICKTIKHIERNMQRFEMSDWVVYNGLAEKTRTKVGTVLKEGFCGTKACFAGTATLLSVPKETPFSQVASLQINGMSINEYAQKKLGLTGEEADMLFTGTACTKSGPEAQLQECKLILNAIFEGRGEPERFKV